MPQTSGYFVKKSTRLYFNWCLVHFWVLLAPMAIPLFACGADSRPPWNARQIADMGADGVDQGPHSDCWFLASLADLARLPRGRQRLADMLSYGPSGSWVVRFPDNGSQYSVTREDINALRLRDRALWARVIECACLKRFPNNQGANDPESGRGHPGTGLHCLTGSNTESAHPQEMTDEELCSFIYSPVRAENPVLCATNKNVPRPLVGGHVYSIIDIDMTRRVVTLRNPWGHNPDSSDHGNGRDKDSSKNSGGRVHLTLSQLRSHFFVVTRSYL